MRECAGVDGRRQIEQNVPRTRIGLAVRPSVSTQPAVSSSAPAHLRVSTATAFTPRSAQRLQLAGRAAVGGVFSERRARRSVGHRLMRPKNIVSSQSVVRLTFERRNVCTTS